MALREVDEAEYAALQGVHGVVAKMMANKASRELVLKARKVIDPNASIPEIDAAEPVKGELTEIRGLVQSLNDRLDKDATQRAEADQIARFQNKWADQEADLRRGGWRPAGIKAVREFAEEHGITDLSIAADAWQVRNPDPAPSTTSNGAWDMFSGSSDKADTYVDDLMKAGGDDPRRVDREIADILRDVRSQR